MLLRLLHTIVPHTVLYQVEGSSAGLDLLVRRVRSEGVSVLFTGALAASAATVVGHYPWFLVYNTLQDTIPTANSLVANVIVTLTIYFFYF